MEFNIKIIDKTISTNTLVKKEIANYQNGDVLIAREQTGGRGRQGKAFSSPAGGLYMSLVLDAKYKVAEMPFITVLAGVSVLRTVGEGAKIKWPNDLYIGSKKLCGILTELVACGSGHKVIIGIGLNLNTAHGLPPEAVCLRDVTGKNYDIIETAKKILTEIQNLYQDMDKNYLSKVLIENLYAPSDEMDMWLERFGIEKGDFNVTDY